MPSQFCPKTGSSLEVCSIPSFSHFQDLSHLLRSWSKATPDTHNARPKTNQLTSTVGWGSSAQDPGFGGVQDTTSIKAKIVNLIASVRTLMRSEFCRIVTAD